MPYATQADLEARFGEAAIAGLVSALPASGLGVILADVDAEIDAALAVRYTLPLSTVPPLLVGIACDIARWRLYADEASERTQKAADAARRLLVALGNGGVSLGLPTASAPVASGGPSFVAPGATFSATEGF